MSSFVYTTAIKKIRKLEKRIKIIQGGTSAGKTYGIIPVLINKAAKCEGLEISIVSESIPHLRRGALKDFLKIMTQTNRFIPDHYNRTLLKYTFSTGSYIEFFSAEQQDKLRGARRTHLYVNEANNINFDSYYQLAIRTSQDIYIDFNPTNEFWAHTELRDDEDSDFIILTYKDNEALPETIVKEIEKAKEKAKTSNYWRNWWNVYGLGEIGSLQGVVFENWKKTKTIPEAAKYVGTGLDFGFTNDPTAAVDVYKFEGNYYLDEVVYQTGVHNNEINNLLKDKKRFIIADSAEPKSISDLRRMGLRIKESVKGRDSVMYGIELMQREQLFVTERSVNLIKELRSYQWETTKSGEKINKPVDAFNHAIDSVRYVFQTLIGRTGTGKYSVS